MNKRRICTNLFNYLFVIVNLCKKKQNIDLFQLLFISIIKLIQNLKFLIKEIIKSLNFLSDVKYHNPIIKITIFYSILFQLKEHIEDNIQ